MQTTVRKTENKVKSKEKISKDDATPLSKKPVDEKLKKSVYSVSTPRNYVQKSTTADIYAQKKKNTLQVTKAPKKVPGMTNKDSNVSPMKDQLKSSSSSVSHISQASAKRVPNPQKIQTKFPATSKNSTPRTGKDLPILNVTVNSPIAKRRLENKDGGSIEDARRTKDSRNLNLEEARKRKDGRNSNTEEARKSKNSRNSNMEDARIKDSKRSSNEDRSSQSKEVKRKSSDLEVGRQRTKTRTLADNEVKVLTPDAVDNNAEMLKLSRQLTAKPKAFYVDLEDPDKNKVMYR